MEETTEEFMIGAVIVKRERTWLCRHCGQRLVRKLGDGVIKHWKGKLRCYDKDGMLMFPFTEATPTDWV